MVQEMFSAISIQLRIAQYPIQKEIGKLLHQITLNLSQEYLTSENSEHCDMIFHSLIEAIIFPFHLDGSNPDLINQTMETIFGLQQFFEIKNLSVYRPFLAHLCCVTLAKSTNELVISNSIKALVSLVTKQEKSLFATLNTIFEQMFVIYFTIIILLIIYRLFREIMKGSTIFMMLAAISLISLSSETVFPTSIQSKISANLHAFICGENSIVFLIRL